jgi:wyosine [tRNA(Phe)-imidazoG37] synthetase (radical SAM superfamily)
MLSQKVTNVKYVFGPVPSRRLGRSLGVDLIPFKSCTFDCLYCQLGSTGTKTAEPQDEAPIDEVIAELSGKLSERPDYITLSGSGEPTLYTRLGELIERIRLITDIPVAVITNGSLLWDERVRKCLLGADVVMPSLDAGDEEMYQMVNRPHGDISFKKLVDGLVLFREEYSGRYWLEVLLLAGLTDTREQVGKIAQIAKSIRPDIVQLNTCVRPGAEKSARTVERERLLELAKLFSPEAQVIADYQVGQASGASRADKKAILDMLSRRPCTVADVAAGLQIHLPEALKRLEDLVREGLVDQTRAQNGDIHYVVLGRKR